MYPLLARPTEVEWIELKYGEGRQSVAGPSVRVIDMKKKPAWESADPVTTFDIVPMEPSVETSTLIVPVNVISITPGKVSSLIFFLFFFLAIRTPQRIL